MANSTLPLSVKDDPSESRAPSLADACWRALDETLSIPRQASRAPQPKQVRSRLRTLLKPSSNPKDVALAADAGCRLNQIVDGASPDAVSGSPGELADDVALIRCLREQPDASSELIEMRSYLASARLSRRHPDLETDRAITREQLSFVTILGEPHRLDSIRTTFDMFRNAYRAVYTAHHKEYYDAVEQMRFSLADLAIDAQALERLNTLGGLGKPVGLEGLSAFEGLQSLRAVCGLRDLEASLLERPTCASCCISMEDIVPTEDIVRVQGLLHSALTRQQTRLAGEAVRRVLARGGERLEQFIEIAQAADVGALTSVLNDELLSFLSGLLSQPPLPTAEAIQLFEELVSAHPIVAGDQIDAVAETLRKLLEERLNAQRIEDPSAPVTIRLADEPKRP